MSLLGVGWTGVSRAKGSTGIIVSNRHRGPCQDPAGRRVRAGRPPLTGFAHPSRAVCTQPSHIFILSGYAQPRA
jgi:hypothetical protein